jgi:ribonuclease E
MAMAAAATPGVAATSGVAIQLAAPSAALGSENIPPAARAAWAWATRAAAITAGDVARRAARSAAEAARVRAPREPKRHVLVDDVPLVLVETRKDLSQLKLPFDQAAG